MLRLPGATQLSQIWADPANPEWSQNVQFPEGSVVFKILMTDATDDELPLMAASPSWKVVCLLARLLTC